MGTLASVRPCVGFLTPNTVILLLNVMMMISCFFNSMTYVLPD